jgi:hypothetical protein
VVLCPCPFDMQVRNGSSTIRNNAAIKHGA